MRHISSGNLSDEERAWSALWGTSLSLMAVRRLPSIGGVFLGAAAVGFFARALAGHCAVKASLARETTFKQGVSDQWRRMWDMPATRAPRSSQMYASASDVIDVASEDSFPASDPPASRLPDEPPANAEAKWAAAAPGRRESETKS